MLSEKYGADDKSPRKDINMNKILKRIKGKETDNQTMNRQTRAVIPSAKPVPDIMDILKRITPISAGKCCEVFNGETLDQMADNFKCFGSKHPDVCVIDSENKIEPLTEGYFMAKCSDVSELPDKKTVLLTFDPHDEEGRRRSNICLTLPKVIAKSEALGEFIFGLGCSFDEAHSNDTLVIRDMDAFRERVLGKEYGIEVSVNLDTGWLYITDFFHLIDPEDKMPACPNDIIRNVF